MSLFPQGTLAKYYAWLCDTTTQLHYDIQNEGYLHMLGKYSVKPRMFVCCDFAENVYVMKKMLSEFFKKLSHVKSTMQKNEMQSSGK
jgi:hypothetical protein